MKLNLKLTCFVVVCLAAMGIVSCAKHELR